MNSVRISRRPFPLPVQALDHATGYLIAATVIRGVTRRLSGEGTIMAKLSLARTAQCLLNKESPTPANMEFSKEDSVDWCPQIEHTFRGEAYRLKAPVDGAGTPMAWILPGNPFGSAKACWD